MIFFGQIASNWAHVAAAGFFAAFELICLALGIHQSLKGGPIHQATGQNLLLLGWIGLYAASFFYLYYRASIHYTGNSNFFWSWGGMLVNAACVLLAAYLLFRWGKGAPSFVAPVILKIVIQVALLTAILFLIFKFWDFMGGKILPHILGIHAPFGKWWLTSPLPLTLNALLSLAVLVFVAVFLLSMKNASYGVVSSQGLFSLFGLALFLGPSWKFAQAREKWSVDHADFVSGKTGTVNSVRMAEARFGTKDWNAITFHMLAEDKHGLALSFPGYLVGVEKANRYFLDVEEGPEGAFDTPAHTQKIGKYLCDRKRTFVSHIVKYTQGHRREVDIEAAFLFNLYDSAGAKDYRGAYRKGFAALDTLRIALMKDIDAAEKPYSHILAFCMGWNTDQQESIRNYNSLRGYLDDSAMADPDFKPLFVGITWPSQWAGFLPLSYPAKADDADETGLVWANYLLKKVLAPVKEKGRLKNNSLKTVLVGHSFGTRVLTRALSSDPAWILPAEEWNEMDKAVWNSNGVDYFVGLQGAFGADRFVEKGVISGGGWEGAPYKDFPRMKTRFLFTWSREDKANPLAAYVTGANHIGGNFGAYLGRDNPTIFQSVTYGREFSPGNGWSAEIRKAPDSNRILLLDVSKIVKDHPYGKGGGAHSDIYKAEIGCLLWKSISTLNTPNSTEIEIAVQH